VVAKYKAGVNNATIAKQYECHIYDHSFLRKAQKFFETGVPNAVDLFDIMYLEEAGTLQSAWR